jgi:radical SAM superfamily enzyme YgiQ (UPF0313 family)
MKIASLVFGGARTTSGIRIVEKAIMDRFPHAKIKIADPLSAKQADYLLVSLYWWKDCYEFVRFLIKNGIDPRKRRPTIIIGGQMAVNPRPLEGYFHYCVVGDGEKVIGELLAALEGEAEGLIPEDIEGVWNPEKVQHADVAEIEPYIHSEQRKRVIERIEIARGCRQQCDFCQLGWTKPYREQSLEKIEGMIQKTTCKTISLYCPDTFSHSRALEILELTKKYGKDNSGTDLRLDEIGKIKEAHRLRFGVEGFSEKTRKRFRKVRTNEDLKRQFFLAASQVKTPKGKPMKHATCYMIGNLPGEGQTEIDEFWEVLGEIDSELEDKFTLFLSVSSFAPAPHTPMWSCGIDINFPFDEIYKKNQPTYKRLIIANRGGVENGAQRLLRMIFYRGDESLSRVVCWVSGKNFGLVNTVNDNDLKTVKAAINSAGFDWQNLTRQYDASENPPWSNVETFTNAWRKKTW